MTLGHSTLPYSRMTRTSGIRKGQKLCRVYCCFITENAQWGLFGCMENITAEHFRYASRSAPVDGVLLIDMHLDTGVDGCLPASWLLPWIVEARVTHLWHLVPVLTYHCILWYTSTSTHETKPPFL